MTTHTEAGAVWQTLKGVVPGARVGYTTAPSGKLEPAPKDLRRWPITTWRTIARLEADKAHKAIRLHFTDGSQEWGGLATRYWVDGGVA